MCEVGEVWVCGHRACQPDAINVDAPHYFREQGTRPSQITIVIHKQGPEHRTGTGPHSTQEVGGGAKRCSCVDEAHR